DHQVQRILSSKVLENVDPAVRAQIQQNIKAIQFEELPHLPDEISSSASNYETEVELEMQTEQEQEQEKEVEKEIEIQVEQDVFDADRRFASRVVVSWEGPLSRADFLGSPASALANLKLARANFYTLSHFRKSLLSPVISVQEALQKFELPIPFDA